MSPAQTGRTRDRTRPILHQRHKALAKAPSTRDPKRTVRPSWRGLDSALPAETALIGFCGAPWTVSTYKVGGEGSSDQAAGGCSPTVLAQKVGLAAGAEVTIDDATGGVKAAIGCLSSCRHCSNNASTSAWTAA